MTALATVIVSAPCRYRVAQSKDAGDALQAYGTVPLTAVSKDCSRSVSGLDFMACTTA